MGSQHRLVPPGPRLASPPGPTRPQSPSPKPGRLRTLSGDGSWHDHRFARVKHHGLLRISLHRAGVVESSDLAVFCIENDNSLLTGVRGESPGTRNKLQDIEIAQQRICPGVLNLSRDVDLSGVDLHDRNGYLWIGHV